MTTRVSRAEWNGDLPTGKGELEVGDGVFTGSYTFASRFEEGEGTNPEELAAAAHAACFSMALSNMLAQAYTPPDSAHPEAAMHLEKVDGSPTITRVELTTRGRVPGIDADAFLEHAEKAKAGCPISKLFAGAEITLDAQLES
jgi:lipoyl-dependent peroxiredoxin